MWNNEEIMQIAMRQSALDLGCEAADFTREENVVVIANTLGPKARCYYEEPVPCNFVSYGNNVVASVHEELCAVAEEYIDKFECYHCFETPAMQWLDEQLHPKNLKVCFMAEYFLPDLHRLSARSCAYETRFLSQKDFPLLYTPAWSNALCERRKERDVLGIGAYDKDILIGLAACSTDCDTMYQIGVDVLPAYRRRGIASALTSTLALEILSRNIVPFYCSAWSNLRSVRNALASGFSPAWVEMTVKPAETVKRMNGAEQQAATDG